MTISHKLTQGLFGLAIAISTPYAFAADTTNEGAKSTRSGEVVTTSKEGVKVHSVKEPNSLEKSDRKHREQKEKEQKRK